MERVKKSAFSRRRRHACHLVINVSGSCCNRHCCRMCCCHRSCCSTCCCAKSQEYPRVPSCHGNSVESQRKAVIEKQQTRHESSPERKNFYRAAQKLPRTTVESPTGAVTESGSVISSQTEVSLHLPAVSSSDCHRICNETRQIPLTHGSPETPKLAMASHGSEMLTSPASESDTQDISNGPRRAAAGLRKDRPFHELPVTSGTSPSGRAELLVAASGESITVVTESDIQVRKLGFKPEQKCPTPSEESVTRSRSKISLTLTVESSAERHSDFQNRSKVVRTLSPEFRAPEDFRGRSEAPPASSLEIVTGFHRARPKLFPTPPADNEEEFCRNFRELSTDAECPKTVELRTDICKYFHSPPKVPTIPVENISEYSKNCQSCRRVSPTSLLERDTEYRWDFLEHSEVSHRPSTEDSADSLNDADCCSQASACLSVESSAGFRAEFQEHPEVSSTLSAENGAAQLLRNFRDCSNVSSTVSIESCADVCNGYQKCPTVSPAASAANATGSYRVSFQGHSEAFLAPSVDNAARFHRQVRERSDGSRALPAEESRRLRQLPALQHRSHVRHTILYAEGCEEAFPEGPRRPSEDAQARPGVYNYKYTGTAQFTGPEDRQGLKPCSPVSEAKVSHLRWLLSVDVGKNGRGKEARNARWMERIPPAMSEAARAPRVSRRERAYTEREKKKA